MSPSGTIKLILLAMVWGASFLFMRVAAPEFGPVPLILVRVGVAAAVMLPLLVSARGRGFLAGNWPAISFVGIVNSAIPFCLFAYATLSLEAGFTSLLNATTPIFAAVVGSIWFRSPLNARQIGGLAVALTGMTVLSWDKLEFKEGGSGWAIAACLSATLAYGLSANYSKSRLAGVPPRIVAAGGMVPATLFLLPAGIGAWPEVPPSLLAWGCALALALLGTAAAYVLYFDLIATSGAMAATTVTFLIPVFGILWGAWLLGEAITPRLLIGMGITLAGTALCVGLPGRLRTTR